LEWPSIIVWWISGSYKCCIVATVNLFSNYFLFLSLSKHNSFTCPGSWGLSVRSTLHLICFSFCFYATKSAIYLVGLTCLVDIFGFIGEVFLGVNIFSQLKRSYKYFSIFSNRPIILALPLLWFKELFCFSNSLPKSAPDTSYFRFFFVFFKNSESDYLSLFSWLSYSC